MRYCVVSPDMGGRVRKSVERALRGEPGLALLVERRRSERRGGFERRRHAGPHIVERRRVGYSDGRRVAERRAVLVPVPAPAGVARVARHEGVAFFEPLEVPADFQADVEAVRAIVRFKSGERDITELYERWLEPVYTYLNVTLDRGDDVEAHVSSVLADALHELPYATPGPTEVRPWLFGVAYRRARPRALELTHPLAADRERPPTAEGAAERGLTWLSDDELLMLVGRRPPAERHVLVLRYFVGLTFAEIATVMGIDPAAVIALHRSAVASLDATLAAAGRGTRVQERHPMERLTHHSPALRQRRRALLAA